LLSTISLFYFFHTRLCTLIEGTVPKPHSISLLSTFIGYPLLLFELIPKPVLFPHQEEFQN